MTDMSNMSLDTQDSSQQPGELNVVATLLYIFFYIYLFVGGTGEHAKACVDPCLPSPAPRRGSWGSNQVVRLGGERCHL